MNPTGTGVWVLAVVAFVLVAAPGIAAAESRSIVNPSVQFVDVSAERGILLYKNERGQGSGLAAADFDGDGDVDVYVPQAEGRGNQLYVNTGEGYFVQRAGLHGLGISRQGRVALWFDYDNDRDLDLMIANDDENQSSSFHFYRQKGDGTFEDVTQAAGFVKPPVFEFIPLWWGGLCAGDINNDGYLDFFSTQWGGPSHLFLNNTDGTFTDISESSNVGVEWLTRHQPIMADFNGDGWLDIYIAIDFDPNELWINQGDNTFLNEAASAGVANAMNDMGVTLGDYDNDGDLDIYLTNIAMDGKYNMLYRNDSNGGTLRFTDVTAQMGVGDGAWGWGTTFFDMDRDGYLDIAATNGWSNSGWVRDTSRVFWNRTGGTTPFVEEAVSVGFDDTYWGSGLVAVDFDQDGDLDLMQTCIESSQTTARLRLLDNQSGAPVDANRWLLVRPRIDGPNHWAIGATVYASVAGKNMMRLITAGTSYLSQEPAEAFFGLGNAAIADLRIVWPDGGVTGLSDVAADQVITITRPAVLAPTVIVSTPDVTAARVQLEWQVQDRPGLAVDVERSGATGPWTVLASKACDAEGRVSHEDATVTPGLTYRYRLAFEESGTPFKLGEVLVDVPAANIRLSGVHPNPSTGPLQVSFTLPSLAAGRLELVDLGGRMLRAMDLSGFGPGDHTVDFGIGLDLRPGVYVLRLVHGGTTVSRKAAIVP